MSIYRSYGFSDSLAQRAARRRVEQRFAGGIGVMWAGFLKRDYGLGTAFGSITIFVTAAGIVVLAGYFFLRRQDRLAQTVVGRAAAPAIG